MHFSRQNGLSIVGAVAILMTVAAAPVPVRAQNAPGVPGQVTFTKDVAPILQRSCQTCHRPGMIAPMSLLTYEDARPWARSIKPKVVASRDAAVVHRPARRHPEVQGRSVADRRGDRDDRQVGRRGRAAGQSGRHAAAARSSAISTSGTSASPTSSSRCRSRTCCRPRAGRVHRRPDRSRLQGRHVRDGDRDQADRAEGFKVVHHATTNLIEDEDDPTGFFFNEYAIGKNGDVFPPDSGRLIKAGSKINFNLHLHPNGEETPVDVQLGLKLLPQGQVPKYVAFTQHMGDVTDLDIPAGAGRRATTATSGCRSRR